MSVRNAPVLEYGNKLLACFDYVEEIAVSDFSNVRLFIPFADKQVFLFARSIVPGESL